MKILVISDSHGRTSGIQRALSLHPDAEQLIFLGDGAGDLRIVDQSAVKITAVRGNCDFLPPTSDLPFTRVISVMGKRIFMCHGNNYGAGSGSGALLYAAMEAQADVCLYGHTHVKHNEYVSIPDRGGIYLFNPGSISCPRDCTTPSYGVIEIRENGILLSHGFIR